MSNLTYEKKLEIYQACVKNCKDLKSKKKVLLRLLNLATNKNSQNEIDTLTKLLALLYSSYAESSFLKLIMTPYALSCSYVEEINRQYSLPKKWEKFFQIVFQQYSSNPDLKNKEQIIKRIYEDYIQFPSELRNKVAHGQWIICLNEHNTGINKETTDYLSQIDFVQIDRFFNIYEKYIDILKDLLESPKTHKKDFYNKLLILEDFIEKTKGWNLATKRNALQKKYSEYWKKENSKMPK